MEGQNGLTVYVHVCERDRERKERSLAFYGTRQKEATPLTPSVKNSQLPHREGSFPMQMETKLNGSQRSHGGRDNTAESGAGGAGGAGWTSGGWQKQLGHFD